MVESEFLKNMWRFRLSMEEFGRIIDECEGEGGFVPSQDADFWRSLDRIEAAGHNKDEAEVPWLASLTQVDDLGPMGRALFLSWSALGALKEMPIPSLAEGKRLSATLPEDASGYRKIGLCLVLAASSSDDALPLIRRIVEEGNPYVQMQGAGILQQLLKEIERRSGNAD